MNVKPICYVMVGLPGIGKSYLVEKYCDMMPDAFVYSTDAYIEECAQDLGKTYSEVFQDYIDEAIETMNNFLKMAIHNKMYVIWDQTNLTKKKRGKILEQMKRSGYRVEANVIHPPVTTQDYRVWDSRLKIRPGKVIPEHVLDNMVKTFQPVTSEEGFDAVFNYDMYGSMIEWDIYAKYPKTPE